MAFTNDSVLAKLSALNETQESIVTVAQWVMFHRRHSDQTAQLWIQRLKDSTSNKRLNLIYLANEVVQQSKIRKKEDFVIAFSPVIAEATAIAYRGATNEVQQKLRRVVEVWRQRAIFELPIQEAIENRVDEIDKSRSGGKRNGGSIFSSNTSSVPAELTEVTNAQQTATKLALSTKTSLNSANLDYDKLIGPDAVIPSAPVHAARLNGLLKTLANAEGAVAESIKARKVLIEGLEKLLVSNKATLVDDETQLSVISKRRVEIDAKKKDVEDSIMRGLGTGSNPGTPAVASPGVNLTPATPGSELDRPEIEALTPPIPPQASPSVPAPAFNLDTPNGNGTLYSNSYTPPASTNSMNSAKKRKLASGDEYAGLNDDDLDPEIAAMI